MSWLALLPCEVCELLLECRADIHAQEGEHALNMPQHAPPKPTGTPKPSSFSFGCAFFAWSLHRHMFRLVFDHVLPFCSSFKYPLHQAACGVAEGATEGSDYGILRLSILASFFYGLSFFEAPVAWGSRARCRRHRPGFVLPSWPLLCGALPSQKRCTSGAGEPKGQATGTEGGP